LLVVSEQKYDKNRRFFNTLMIFYLKSRGTTAANAKADDCKMSGT
jgi:hypothetical protein